jgi:hypothetical protein
MHPRKAIRHAAVDLLIAGISAVGGRVFRSRVYPMGRADLPGICVYTIREPNEEMTIAGRLQRDLEMAVDIYVRNSNTPDDELDDIAETVEAVMAGNRKLTGTAQWNSLIDTTIGFSGEGEKANGLARLRYRVRYFTP